MKVGSLFSGIGGMDRGLEAAGWNVTWQVEKDPWCRRVLAARFPGAVQYGDIRERRDYDPVDLLSFGFPCTDLSVAGKREGLGGDESRLFWAAIGIARRLRPPWLLVENVPGLLSSNQGRDFGIVLGALAHIGYWWAYRVLDSQYFGVPQRRRRVYIVGHLGAPVPTEVLFEPAGVPGDTPPRGRSRAEVAGAVTASAGHHGHSSPRGDGSDTLVPSRGATLSGHHPRNDPESTYIPSYSHPLLAKGNSSFDDSLETYVVNARQNPIHTVNKSLPLDAGTMHAVVAGTVTGAEAHNGNSRPIPKNYVINAADPEPLTLDGVRHMIESYAYANKADADQILFLLREAVDSQEGARRRLGELVPFWPTEVLRPSVYGAGLRHQADDRDGLEHSPLPSAEDSATGAVLPLWNLERLRCPSQGRESSEQRCPESGAGLPLLPHGVSQQQEGLLSLWETSEGARLLQQALHAFQEARRPVAGQAEPAPPAYSVRRLTVAECEALQGLPRGWTCLCPALGDTMLCTCSDNPRYRGLGNAVTAPVAEWIGRRILEAAG